jgi:hypothetical protein
MLAEVVQVMGNFMRGVARRCKQIGCRYIAIAAREEVALPAGSNNAA